MISSKILLKGFCTDLRYYYVYFIFEDSAKEVLYGPEVLLHIWYHRRFCERGIVWTWGTTSSIISRIFFKEVLYEPEVLHLLYHRRFCQRGSVWTWGTTLSIISSKILLKRFCMDLRYYIYYIIEDSFKEVLYGHEVLLHVLYHRRVC